MFTVVLRYSAYILSTYQYAVCLAHTIPKLHQTHFLVVNFLATFLGFDFMSHQLRSLITGNLPNRIERLNEQLNVCTILTILQNRGIPII